jgi:deoxyhypusine synthase
VKAKRDLLKEPIEHVSLDSFDPVPLIAAMGKMAFQARNTARAARIYERMLADPDCGIILCLAGSLVSAGLKKVIVQMIENDMVDAIVSTGANLVDQDFFEGLGFKHYIGTPDIDDQHLRELAIDRIYDTFIDEDELRICDDTIRQIADSLEPRPYSSREFLREMGRYLADRKSGAESIVRAAFARDVPLFCPAFSDCSAGFGMVLHQAQRDASGEPCMSLDSARDFLELTKIKVECGTTGLFMVGGGVPKNFAQDIVVSAELLGEDVDMHKYAVQITVADERDGGLSGSTLKEACSWGKVDTVFEQMVYGEATVLMPLIVGYAWHRNVHANRGARRFARLFTKAAAR